jgi:hypothetical protein
MQTNQNDINKQSEIFTHKINEMIKNMYPRKQSQITKEGTFHLIKTHRG